MDVEDLPQSSEEARRLAEDAHLLDPGNLQEIALWIVSAAGSGVIGNTVFDVLKAVRKRFGASKVDDLKKLPGKWLALLYRHFSTGGTSQQGETLAH